MYFWQLHFKTTSLYRLFLSQIPIPIRWNKNLTSLTLVENSVGTKRNFNLEESLIQGKRDLKFFFEKCDKKKGMSTCEGTNITQSGGSCYFRRLESLPGIHKSWISKVNLRGSNQIIILIDGKKTIKLWTGFMEGQIQGGLEGNISWPLSIGKRHWEYPNNPKKKLFLKRLQMGKLQVS